MIHVCKKCGVHWYSPVKRCIYCNDKTEALEPTSFTVKGVTEVFVPSPEHRTVPYYSLLLEDEYGFNHIKKTHKKYGIGDIISTAAEKKQHKGVIAVVGAGILGTDIAKVMLKSGYRVILNSRKKESLERAKTGIEGYLMKNFDVKDKDDLMNNLELTTDIAKIKKADYVLECVIEDFEVKKAVFKKLEKICGPKTILATNTSSLSINELSAGLSKRDRFVGMHFFNPATKMQLVEVVKGEKTSDKAVDSTVELVKNLNKTPIVVKDSPCFIANRILMPYLNESIYVLHEGVARKEDIDTTAKLALNHPMGPLELLDLIGLDVFLEIMKNMQKTTKNPEYKPCPLAEKMVSEGRLGKKTGWGFYKY